MTPATIKDITGREFGKYTVLAYAGTVDGAHAWRCRCVCGREDTLTRRQLTRTSTCRDCRAEAGRARMSHARAAQGNIAADLTGLEFGQLTVLERVGTTRHREAIWLCECDCGSTREVRASGLKRGETKACVECVEYSCHALETSPYMKYWREYLAGMTVYQRAYYDAILRGRQSSWIKAEAVEVVMRERDVRAWLAQLCEPTELEDIDARAAEVEAMSERRAA